MTMVIITIKYINIFFRFPLVSFALILFISINVVPVNRQIMIIFFISKGSSIILLNINILFGAKVGIKNLMITHIIKILEFV